MGSTGTGAPTGQKSALSWPRGDAPPLHHHESLLLLQKSRPNCARGHIFVLKIATSCKDSVLCWGGASKCFKLKFPSDPKKRVITVRESVSHGFVQGEINIFMFNVLPKQSPQMFPTHSLQTPFLGYNQGFMNIFEGYQTLNNKKQPILLKMLVS